MLPSPTHFKSVEDVSNAPVSPILMRLMQLWNTRVNHARTWIEIINQMIHCYQQNRTDTELSWTLFNTNIQIKFDFNQYQSNCPKSVEIWHECSVLKFGMTVDNFDAKRIQLEAAGF